MTICKCWVVVGGVGAVMVEKKDDMSARKGEKRRKFPGLYAACRFIQHASSMYLRVKKQEVGIKAKTLMLEIWVLVLVCSCCVCVCVCDGSLVLKGVDALLEELE